MTLQWRANRSPSREWLPQSLTSLKDPGQAQPWSGFYWRLRRIYRSTGPVCQSPSDGNTRQRINGVT
jgi:hypothetical protein